MTRGQGHGAGTGGGGAGQGLGSGATGCRGNREPVRGGDAGAPPRGQAAGRPPPLPGAPGRRCEEKAPPACAARPRRGTRSGPGPVQHPTPPVRGAAAGTGTPGGGGGAWGGANAGLSPQRRRFQSREPAQLTRRDFPPPAPPHVTVPQGAAIMGRAPPSRGGRRLGRGGPAAGLRGAGRTRGHDLDLKAGGEGETAVEELPSTAVLGPGCPSGLGSPADPHRPLGLWPDIVTSMASEGAVGTMPQRCLLLSPGKPCNPCSKCPTGFTLWVWFNHSKH